MRKDRKERPVGRPSHRAAPSERSGSSRRPSDAGEPRPRRGFPRIVDPGQEHGVPYPGDIPNPLAGKYRGCF